MSPRRTTAKLLLGILLVLSLLKIVFVWEQGIILRPETFPLGDWGEQPGQFGRVKIGDGGWYGPQHFCVFDRKLIIADPVNERIQIFGWPNELQVVEAVNLPSMRGVSGLGWLNGDDLLLQDAESGILYLFIDDHWLEWATEIEPPEENTLVLPTGLMTVNGSAYHAVSWLTVSGEIWQLWRLTAEGLPELLISWSDAGISTDDHQPTFVVDNQIYASVLGFVISLTGNVALQVVEREGLTPALLLFDARLVRAQKLEPSAGAFQLVGLDQANNAYLTYGDQLRIYREDGRLLGETTLPTANRLQGVQLDEKGHLYALVHSEQGVDLIRYRRVSTGRLALRWRAVDEAGKRLPS